MPSSYAVRREELDLVISRHNIRPSQEALLVKNPPADAGDIKDAGSIPGSGRFPEEGNDYPLQYSCLENPMDRGAWGVWSIGSQRVRHSGSDLSCTHTDLFL